MSLNNIPETSAFDLYIHILLERFLQSSINIKRCLKNEKCCTFINLYIYLLVVLRVERELLENEVIAVHTSTFFLQLHFTAKFTSN